MDIIVCKDFNTHDWYLLNDTNGQKIYCESEEEAKKIAFCIEYLRRKNR